MSGERKKDVLLVLHEAAMNAIVHGNRLDPEKHVTITVQIDPERLLISVRDEGEGFDPAQLADPLEPENIMKQSGRGIFLIRHYAYKVHYSKEGNEVDIIMHI